MNWNSCSNLINTPQFPYRQWVLEPLAIPRPVGLFPDINFHRIRYHFPSWLNVSLPIKYNNLNYSEFLRNNSGVWHYTYSNFISKSNSNSDFKTHLLQFNYLDFKAVPRWWSNDVFWHYFIALTVISGELCRVLVSWKERWRNSQIYEKAGGGRGVGMGSNHAEGH